jgi:hypothetical protein
VANREQQPEFAVDHLEVAHTRSVDPCARLAGRPSAAKRGRAALLCWAGGDRRGEAAFC